MLLNLVWFESKLCFVVNSHDIYWSWQGEPMSLFGMLQDQGHIALKESNKEQRMERNDSYKIMLYET